MNSVLEKKYPYLSNFFNEILKSSNKNIANSLVFYGSDVLAQYYFALSLAKALNCTEQNTDNCECVNCNWINKNKHPAIMTISKIDSKSDDAKTVISKQQIDMVRDSLVNSSTYHRVYIFCDAEFKSLSGQEQERIKEFKELGINLPESDKEDLCWFPKGLSRGCFQDVAANALLKSIEEPPENVTFIFLTEDNNDLISTIISRSQSFFVPNFSKQVYEVDFLTEYFSNYPEITVDSSIKFSKSLLEYQSQNDLSIKHILDCMQFYLKEILVSNKSNRILFNKIMKDIDRIQESKKMVDSHLKDSLVYEDLLLYFSR